MNKILNLAGLGLLIIAGYQRFVIGTLEPAYSLGLMGGIAIGLSVWMRDR